MVNSYRDRRDECCATNQDEHSVVRSAWIYIGFFTLWFLVAASFGFPIKEHKERWHTSKQTTYRIVDKKFISTRTNAAYEYQMTLDEGSTTQFTLKDVSREVYNSKNIGESITLKLTDAEKFPDSHDHCGFLKSMMVIVLLGACILVLAFFNIMLGVEDYDESDVSLLMTKGHHLTKICMILTIVLGVLILKSKYFC